MNEWFAQLVEKLLEMKWYTWVIVVALIAFGAAVIVDGRKKNSWTGRRLAIAAMCIAISFVLSTIRLFRLPQGGSITPIATLPLIAFAVAFGPIQGALVGCAYGLLQLIHDPYVIHPIQLLVDYPLSFAALALGGFVRNAPVPEKLKLPLAVVIGSIGRYVMVVVSGVVFFAEYAGDQPVLAYSLVYNISYLGPDALLCAVMAFIPGIARIVSAMRGKTAAKA